MSTPEPNRQGSPASAHAGADGEFATLRRAAGRVWVRAAAWGMLIIIGAGAILAWLFIAGVHMGDRHQIEHVSGAWMALAMHANEQGLYPELFDGERYGGTRFMPVPIVAHAALARITGEYIASGKLLNGVCMALLLCVVFLALVRRHCPRALALALTGSILLTWPGMLAGTSIRNDALPVALQLIAVLMIAGPRGAALIAAAGCVSALAILCKLSAIWAPMAIGLWLLATDRRALLIYIAGFAVFLGAGLGGFHVATGGRMFESLFGLSTSGIEGVGALVRSPFRVLGNLQFFAFVSWLLLPFALCLSAMAAIGRRFSILHLALLCSLAPLTLAFADRGVGPNHLLDLVVLIAVCLGVRTAGEDVWSATGLTRALAAMLLVWTAPFAFVRHVSSPLAEAIETVRAGATPPRHDPHVFRDHFPEDERLLSDDPFVCVSRGELPVVMDAFMLLRIGREHPEWLAPLLDRVEAGEFDAVVTLHPLESRRDFYTTLHFGEELLNALIRRYEETEQVGGYTVHRRRGASAAQRAPGAGWID